MTKPTAIYKPFDVVVVPFPFTNKSATKRRPALILSSEQFNSVISHSVMAMITSVSQTSWLLDIVIQDLQSAGLKTSNCKFKIIEVES